VAGRLIDLLRSAHGIEFLAFFTSDPTPMRSRATGEGVAVRGADGGLAGGRIGLGAGATEGSRPDVPRESETCTLVLIIDRSAVVTGSYSFSQSAGRATMRISDHRDPALAEMGSSLSGPRWRCLGGWPLETHPDN
jgi:hypothetical protein